MKGIVRDRYGFRAYVKVGAIQREKRYPPDTPAKTMQDWRDQTRVALRAAAPASPRGTLKADAERYLDRETVKRLASAGSRRSELAAWCALYGSWPRARITRVQVVEAREKWLAAKVAPKTINHRIDCLRRLYHELDGSRCPTPCDDIRKLDVPQRQPDFVAVSTIRRVAKRLADRPFEQAVFLVLVSTGQRPAQLKRAVPTDVNLRRKVWWVRPAKGGNPIPVFLNPDMIAAWKRLLKLRKAGPAPFGFDTSDYDKRLYAAGWPRHIRPYNAKHTVGIALAEAGEHWEDIRDFFGHKDTKTTRIYTGLVAARLKGASATLAKRKLGFVRLVG